MNVARQNRIRKITTLIQQSPFRLLTDEEVLKRTPLTQGEFESRTTAFIKDAESGLSVDPDEVALAKAILAKQHQAHLPPAVARAYMAPLELAPSYKRPSHRPAVKRAARG